MAISAKSRHSIFRQFFRVLLALALIVSMVLTPFAAIPTQAADDSIAQLEQLDGITEDDPTGRAALTSASVEEATPMTVDKGAAGATDEISASSLDAPSATSGTYIVVLEGDALAAYDGGINGLAATKPAATGSDKLNTRAPESLAYLGYLEQVQATVIGQMNREVGRDVEILYRYQSALNGFAAKLTPSEADTLSKIAGVKAVVPDWVEYKQTDVGPAWQGATEIWGGDFTNLSYIAELSGANEVPPVDTAAGGLGSFTYNMDTKELSYEISVADITGITAAHIHAAPAGSNGGVLFPVFNGTGSFPVSGSVTLDMAQQALLVNGGLYVNVHTSANPGGEIRGQILLNGSMGEGIVVGIVDTGINMDHPSFADIGGDGYDHTNHRGKFYGWCDPDDPDYDPTLVCNDKLIGMWSGDADTPEDYGDHGSHVGSTVAGNVLEQVVVHAPTVDVTVHRISGVAPHANVIGYNIESVQGGGSATGAAIIGATEQAIEDQVDVINYSFGGGAANPWLSAQHWYNVREAGIFVATSAGNSGAAADTIGSPANAPWLMTVGSSSHNRQFSNVLMNLTGGNTVPPADIVGEGVTSGYGPAPIVYAGAVDPNNVGCDVTYPPGTFNGEIVVCDYNSGPQYNGRVNKSINLANAGAGGFILINRVDWKVALMVDSYAIPGMGIPYDQGEALKAWLADGIGHMGTIRGVETEPARGDIMAGFSSRGPNGPLPNVIKPDITAPGRRIVAAVGSYSGVTPPEFDVYQGTSMSSPHAAGAAALLRALYPDWTPAEIQSALMTTSLYDGVLKEDGATQADPFDMGAGRVDLTKAAYAGLVLDESPENLWAANPAEGGDPRTLNLPSMADTECLLTCSWTRTVKSTLDVAETWTASSMAANGVTISVEPAQFTIQPGESQEIVVTANTAGAPLGEWLFGQVMLTPDGDVPAAHFPVAVISATGILPESVTIDTRRDAGSQSVDGLRTVAISDLTIETYGLTSGEVVEFSLTEDPTNGNPYDNLNDGTTIYYNVTVPEGALQLAADIIEAAAPDLDLYVGTGTTPSAATQVCSSTSGSSAESCQVEFPAAGEWWILVQSWSASASAPDAGALSISVVAGDAGNMWVEGPSSVGAGEPFSLRVYWDEPALEAGATWYGGFTIGTDAANPGNIGTILVTLNRHGDDVAKFVSSEVASPGETVSYAIVVDTNVTPEDLVYTLTDVLPDGLTYVDGSATASHGTVDVTGNTLSWTGVMTSALNAVGRYDITTNQDDAMCAPPVGPGGYVDAETLYGFATNPNIPEPGLSGDTYRFSFGSHAGTDFYGTERAAPPLLTDDGIAVFGTYAGSPWINQDIPNAADPNGLLAAYWRDMEIVYDAATNRGVTGVTYGGGIFWLVEFDDIQVYGDPSSTLDMEIMVWNDIDPSAGSYDAFFAYDNVNIADTIGTIGAENDAGDAATQFSYDNFTPTNGLVICLDYVGLEQAVITFDAVVSAQSGVITNEVTHNTDNPGSKEATASVDLLIDDNSVLFASVSSSGKAGNFHYRDEDILAFDSKTGEWHMLFDGSDVGLGSNDVNALQVGDDGIIYLSVSRTTRMQKADGYNGPGTLYNTNVYAFVPDSLGWDTAGTFVLIFEGSDVGLDGPGENIDALYLAGSGAMLVSTLGTAHLRAADGSALRAKDEDLLLFIPTSLGEDTAGSWQLFLDGSEEGLSDSNEDIWGTWFNQGQLFLTTRGGFTVADLSGDGADIFTCNGIPCAFSLAVDGSEIGLDNRRVDGFSFGAMPAMVGAAQAQGTADDTEAEADDEVGDDLLDVDDAELNIHLYLPFVNN